MERRFKSVNLNRIGLAELFQQDRVGKCRLGLPPDASFMYSFLENGQIIAVFYHPSFDLVCPDCAIPPTRVEFMYW